MDAHEVIAPCTLCKTVDVLRPYGDQDAMICFACARAQEAKVRELVADAAAQLKRLG